MNVKELLSGNRGSQSFEPWTVFDQYTWRQLLMGDLAALYANLNLVHKSIMESIGYSWSNTHWHVAAGRDYHPYTWMITHAGFKDKAVFALDVWNWNGNNAVFSGELYPNATRRKDTIDAAIAAMERWSSGIFTCSSCGIETPLTERHSFWAGGYCNVCWEREYKEKEAHTNYN